jgi:transposase-like protein
MSLRKVVKMRSSSLTDDAVRMLLYLALNNISKKWTMPIRTGTEHLTTSPSSLMTGRRSIKQKPVYTKSCRPSSIS